jgi:nitronate monooxygenase
VPGLNCLSVCGLRDGIGSIGQFCIDTRLAYALKGDVKKGLFFRGSERLPFGAEIRPVAALIDYFLTGKMPAPMPAMATAGA